MLSSRRVVAIAKHLARLSIEKDLGEITPSKVKAVIDFIVEFPERERKALIRKYIYFLEDVCQKRTLQIEYTSGCDTDRLRKTMESKAGCALAVNLKENPDLIEGVRLSLGDFIWERSIRSDLELISH